MVILESRICCDICNVSISKESDSGQKDYRNTHTMALECAHWQWHCKEIAEQGWFFGGNAKIRITLHAQCLRCGEKYDTQNNFWGWPNNDHVHSYIKCYTCDFKLNFYSYSVGHWAVIGLTYGLGGAIGLISGGWTGAAFGVLYSKPILETAICSAVLGYNSIVSKKISIKTNIENWKSFTGWKVSKLRRYSNPLYPLDSYDSISNGIVSGFVIEGARYLGMKTQHEWIVAECRDDIGNSNYILILWQSVHDVAIKFDKYDTLDAAKYQGVFWMKSVKPSDLDFTDLNKFVNWIEYKNAKPDTYVWDVYDLISQVFTNGKYQLSVPVASRNDKEAYGNCQTLCQFVMNEFGDYDIPFSCVIL